MRKKERRASILIITLWVLSILTIFAINLSFATRTQLHYTRHLQERLKTYYLARAGVEKAVIKLLNEETRTYEELGIEEDKTKDYIALNESSFNNQELFKELALGDGLLTLSYTIDEAGDGEYTILYGVQDEASKIDLNAAPVEVLISLLERIAGVGKDEATAIAGAIIDWRDEDNQLSTPLGSAEDRYYRNLIHPYEAKDTDFQVLDEVLLVRGMTKEVFEKVKDFITIYGEGKVNINTAPE